MNASEKQLKEFLESREKIKNIKLETQGDETLLSAEAVNLCTVDNKYIFGGISDAFYDSMVEKFNL